VFLHLCVVSYSLYFVLLICRFEPYIILYYIILYYIILYYIILYYIILYYIILYYIILYYIIYLLSFIVINFLFQTPRKASASVSNPRAHMVKSPSGSNIQKPSSTSVSNGKTSGRAGSSKRGFQLFH
jgi:hypothetical protein